MDIIIKDLGFAYPLPGSRELFSNLSLVVRKGEVLGIIGASGIGKTTLLKLIGGLLKPTHGEVTIGGDPIMMHRGEVGFVFQETRLLPWLTVAQNIALPEKIRSRRFFHTADIATLLRDVGLAADGAKYPDELSGGMKQRLGLARALVLSPKVLLLDEPFGSLDVALRTQMGHLLRSIVEMHCCTTVIISHDLVEVCRLCDQVILLRGGANPIAKTVKPIKSGLDTSSIEILHAAIELGPKS